MVRTIKKLVRCWLCLLTLAASAQDPSGYIGEAKYWIVFKDKNGLNTKPALPQISPATRQNRRLLHLLPNQFTDLPVSESYLAQLRETGVQPQCPSRWLNAVSAYITPYQLRKVVSLPFVQELVPINNHVVLARHQPENAQPTYLATVMSQVGARDFAEKELSGKGIAIGVIDAGFFGADTNKALRHVFKEQRIKANRDFVNPTKRDYFGDRETGSDDHGSDVLRAITGFDEEKKMQYGLATEATFYLARTDHGVREFRGEEDYWVAAMEWMDSLGVRLINTSLGYALGFTNPSENYKPEQMNGKTSLISRAAQIAVDEKGLLLVVSAGNEGDEPDWQIISTPADAQGVLSVGATRSRTWDKISYSSVGPEFLPYLKPNVACFSMFGTSFSAPVICGFAACLMQQAPALSNREIIHLIEKSAHLYPYGNNYVGYGVPRADKALQLLTDSTAWLPNAEAVVAKGNSFSTDLGNRPVEEVTVFRKKNQYHVIRQELAKSEAIKPGRLTLRRLPGETRTTIDMRSKVIEVIWQ